MRLTVWPRLDRVGRLGGNLSAGLRYKTSKLSTSAAGRERRPALIVNFGPEVVLVLGNQG
jgi:hypothetical protein